MTTAAESSTKNFKGFHARFRDDSGKIYVAYVCNESIGKDSGRKLFKVQRKEIIGYSGWSGGCKAEYGYGNKHMIYADRQVF